MSPNVGLLDARIRWVLALLCFAAAIVFNTSPAIALLTALAALILAGTALTHSCPVWRLLHVDTARRKTPAPPG